ncbi:uncharacterized protein LOC134182122 [Corticium candelabrum]|uniref:uncharacterized protein LOC134182122 n=1 Tax=Corticium candelabrum TaxID=121492 RepID=UPI002E2650BE|nr:uncharacterized protein LOC134182122 [Corticium candelabrum]XP_062505463.1 uncharacterized protein LOC134182122 [Corticium candelabrum]
MVWLRETTSSMTHSEDYDNPEVTAESADVRLNPYSYRANTCKLGTREVSKDLIPTLHKDMVGVMRRLDKIISLLDSAERDKPKQEEQEIDACDISERVYIGDPSPNVRASKLAVTRAVMKAGRRSLLALNLVDILFNQDCLRRSTVCGSRDSPERH